MDELTAVRLLQNPLGSPAPPGHPGDMVRVSDGTRSVYLLPREYDESSPAHLRWLLAGAGRARGAPSPVAARAATRATTGARRPRQS